MFTFNINNFRGFLNSNFDISKLNVLIGENSGGKSSFIKFLLLIKQSMETPTKDRKINTNGHLIDLGSFEKFINFKADKKDLSFTFLTDEEYLNFFLDFLGIEDIEEYTKKFQYFLKEETELSFNFNKETNEYFTNYIKIFNNGIGTLYIDVSEKMNEPFSDMEDVLVNFIIEHKKYGVFKIKNKISVHGFLMLADPDPIIKYGNEHNIPDLLDEIAHLLLTQNYLWNFLRNIKYINPIKFEPTRILLKRDNNNIQNIVDYESLINVLVFLYESKDSKSKEILKKFNSAINEIGIAEQIKLETNDNIPVSELKVKVSGIWNSIVDVGYGVGLQIPIILQTIISSYNDSDTIIIEQPEIHLHPALHAKFIEVLIKYADNTKIIVETHSEHIIRKIQILTKNKLVDSKEINIYYFENNKGEFKITNHFLDKKGTLSPIFPKGFFDNSYNLVKELY